MALYDELTNTGKSFKVIGEIHSNGEKVTLQVSQMEKA